MNILGDHFEKVFNENTSGVKGVKAGPSQKFPEESSRNISSKYRETVYQPSQELIQANEAALLKTLNKNEVLQKLKKKHLFIREMLESEPQTSEASDFDTTTRKRDNEKKSEEGKPKENPFHFDMNQEKEEKKDDNPFTF
jgi:hypothetical protein